MHVPGWHLVVWARRPDTNENVASWLCPTMINVTIPCAKATARQTSDTSGERSGCKSSSQSGESATSIASEPSVFMKRTIAWQTSEIAS